VQVRHLWPRLMRPMAVAHRRDGSHNPAAAAVLAVLAAFALPG